MKTESMKISIYSFYLFLFGISASEDFLINTSSCKMPQFEPFSAEANQTYNPLPPIQCSWQDLLTHVTIENNTAHLRFKKEYLSQYYDSEEEINCCYRYIERAGTPEEPDVGFSTTPCHFFNSTVALHVDTVLVNCYRRGNTIYENMHRAILVTPSVQEKLERSSRKQSKSKRRALSVALLVVDSISRLNFQRTMPQTRNFLLDNGFIEFLSYSKIGENTFPNFNALLTGLDLNQSKAICKPNLDECPMIWYDYRDEGYVTAYAEDWASISTFNYLLKGFKNPPTDYYFKTYLEAAADSLSILEVDWMPFCAGPESQGERVFNLAQDFTKTFRGQPYFGIFWMNTFSHHHVNTPSRMDHKMKNFLGNIKNNGVLDESMVIVLSDHGMRFGEARRTLQGWYEDKLPMNFISLPPWFQKAHPEKSANLRRNARKLTSTYDLYATLQEVLALSVDTYVPSTIRGCPSCQSLFSNIPHVRSCKQAGIPEVWCTCLGKFDRNDLNITAEMNGEAFKFIERSGMLEPGASFYRLLFSSISRGPEGKSYFLLMFQTARANHIATYEGLFEMANAVDFNRLLSVNRLY